MVGVAASGSPAVGETFPLGRVGGVRVGANWTVALTFGLIAVVLAAGQFPERFPDLPRWSHVLAGTSAAMLFVSSLLVHEIAHALVARRYGVPVERITLWLFGGLGRASGAADPDVDLRVSCVGPIVSVGLAVAFWTLTAGATAAEAPGIVIAVLAWLAAMNLLLAVFNLAPAAPLDGGRVLRSLVWRRTGDRRHATQIAYRAGQVFGLALVALGLTAFVFLPGLGGLWIALIGGLLMTAASAEERSERLHTALEEVPVADLMTPRPLSVRGDLTVEALLEQYVLRTAFSAYPVVDDADAPVGLVTLDRVRQVSPERRHSTLVAEVACPMDRVPVAQGSDTADKLLPGMATCPDGRALVVEGGRLLGMVSAVDVMRHLDPAHRAEAPSEPPLRAAAPPRTPFPDAA